MADFTLNFSYKRVPTLWKFAQCDAFVRGIMGPFGSGKSSACTIEIIRRGLAQEKLRDGKRRTRFAVIRQTYRQLEDTTKKTIFDWLPPRIFGNYSVSKNTYTITAFPDTEIEIIFRALDKPEDVENLMSLELTGAWVNEAREVSVEIIDALTGRVGRYPSIKDGGCTWSGIWMDTNPPDDESWWYQRFEVIKPKGWVLFKQPSGLSPEAENLLTWEEYNELKKNPDADIVPGLPPDYYERMIEGKPKDWIEVYVEGKYAILKQGKPVYEKSYNDEIHYSKEKLNPIAGVPLIIGFDFGLNPSAVIGQLTPSGRLFILDELTSDGVGLEQFIKYYFTPHINQYYPNYELQIVGDPAGVQRAQTDEFSCFDILRRNGYKAIPAPTNTLVERIGAVETFLNSLVEGKPRFQLSNNCHILRKGFISGYHYRKLRVSDERYTDTPEKNKYSHLHDALQYLCLHLTNGKKERKFIPKQDYRPAIPYAGY